ncbi:MAG: hypothetical protein K2X77_11310 [Candidatus Obscuribacterales bacterium]|nr:hypothetical protein [Candidatus Obscuribacterales bacterium]
MTSALKEMIKIVSMIHSARSLPAIASSLTGSNIGRTVFTRRGLLGALLISLLIPVFSLTACNLPPGPPGELNTKTITLEEVNLSTPESVLLKSKEAFEYFPGGHFGDKTQYNGKVADKLGGAYAVHCRAEMPFSIEVKYAAPGISHEDAMIVMHRLLSPKHGQVTNHDDYDRLERDVKQAAEWFSYNDGSLGSLLFAENSNDKVVQVTVFTEKPE